MVLTRIDETGYPTDPSSKLKIGMAILCKTSRCRYVFKLKIETIYVRNKSCITYATM